MLGRQRRMFATNINVISAFKNSGGNSIYLTFKDKVLCIYIPEYSLLSGLILPLLSHSSKAPFLSAKWRYTLIFLTRMCGD